MFGFIAISQNTPVFLSGIAVLDEEEAQPAFAEIFFGKQMSAFFCVYFVCCALFYKSVVLSLLLALKAFFIACKKGIYDEKRRKDRNCCEYAQK